MIVEEADEGSSDEHAALHAHQSSGVGTAELTGGNNFLDERVDGGPVHGRAGAGDERHGVEVPELEMILPGDVRGTENEEAADKIEDDAEVTTVVAVNEDAPEKGDEQAGEGDDDYLEGDFYGGVGGGQDVPADADEVHAATEERDEHGQEKITEATLRPDEAPVDPGCGGSCHRTEYFTIVSAGCSREMRGSFQFIKFRWRGRDGE